MRYRDDDGHLRFKFAGPEDRLSKRHHMHEKNRARELKPPASRKPEPPRRNPQERPVANIGARGDGSARRHRRIYVEAMQQ